MSCQSYFTSTTFSNDKNWKLKWLLTFEHNKFTSNFLKMRTWRMGADGRQMEGRADKADGRMDKRSYRRGGWANKAKVEANGA